MRRAFVNGKFYLSSGRFAEAVLVEDGLFSAVGSNAEIAALANGAPQEDLGGRTVLPGFVDSHLHLLDLGQRLNSLVLSEADSIADVVRRGRAFIAERNIPAGAGILGSGWNQDYFTDEQRLLERRDLDQISTDHPIVLSRACGHAVAANTLALNMAGITAETTFDGGEIRLGPDGEPNGIITENAIALLQVLLGEQTAEQTAQLISGAMRHANASGITSIQTNDAKDESAEAILGIYESMANAGKTSLRVYHQVCFTTEQGLADYIASGRRTRQGNELNQIGPLKMFIDGSLGARTALMRAPYADDPAAEGVLCMSQEQMDRMVAAADAVGMQVATHAIGDGAIDMILSAYEKVAKNGQNPNRHGVVHCQITDMPLLERFKKSDIFAYVQPIFLHYDLKIVESRVGAQLASTSYAFHTMDELGLHVGYGTDAPVEDLNTMDNLHCAVNRQDLAGNPPGGFYANERVPLEKAIDNYTVGSAYASFEENVKGRIAEGYYADMAVLDTDIFSIDPSGIRGVNVDLTVLGGEVVYER